MWKQIINGFALLIVMTVLTGLVYPLVMTGLAQVLFPRQANGLLVYHNGKLVGSELIGQNVADTGYFHGRPSAAGEDGYDAAGSSGSNLGPTSKKLFDTINDNVQKERETNQLSETSLIPADLVMSSASGLDPHISPAAAYLQAERVAKEQNLSVHQVYALIDENTEQKQFGLLGEPRVNVLKLNIGLDTMKK